MLFTAIYAVDDALSLAQKVEAEYFDASIQNDKLLLGTIEDTKDQSRNLGPVVEKRNEILKTISDIKLIAHARGFKPPPLGGAFRLPST